MKTPNPVILILLLSIQVHAEELLRPVSISAEGDAIQTGERLADGSLRVSAQSGSPYQLLLEIADPGITSPVYALRGMIRHEDVEGDGYLQMDSQFAGKGTFFSKTLATAGPLRKLTGTSGWRPFVLPFYANVGDQVGDTVMLPAKLSLSLYLPGSGTVFIREVGLYQYTDGEDPLQAEGQWLGGRTAGLAGAIGGGIIGLWGALIGFLAGRGKARGFVLGSANVMIVCGIAVIAIGLMALVTGQPYAVYFTLLLIGVIGTAVVGAIRKGLPQRYENIELKKIQAMDA